MTIQSGLQQMKLQDLKAKSPTDLLAFAEELEIENASAMRKQDMLFAILKELADRNLEITGGGVLETLQDGFGFLRSPESNYLAGPDDIYVSPSQIRRFGLRTGDTVDGPIRSPKDGEPNQSTFEEEAPAACVVARASPGQGYWRVPQLLSSVTWIGRPEMAAW